MHAKHAVFEAKRYRTATATAYAIGAMAIDMIITEKAA